MSTSKLQGGPGDGAQIWRQDDIDDAALAWTFAADSLHFLTMALRSLGKPELRAKVQSVLDEFLEESTPHDPSAN